MHYYCLFCETQRCDMIAKLVCRTSDHLCLSPKIIQRKWVQGEAREVVHHWLPGYVFIYTREPINPWFPFLGIIRVLNHGELTGQDLEFAQMIERNQGVMGTIRLAEVGDRCTIADPAWEGLHGRIIHMDRERKRVQVEFDFDDNTHTVWVGYELFR